MKFLKTLAPVAALIALPSLGLAQDDAPAPGVNAATDTVFIFNSLLFLIGGFLVFWMAAGFS
ncbi:MAG TPA: ammonium transporter, partial [Citreicella sp.]|nr:ammonium transporter [Citreicella sp.]